MSERSSPILASCICAGAKTRLREARYIGMLERSMPVEMNDLVDDVMTQWPETIRIFLANKMLCPGCPIGCFHSIADACREYEVELEPFLAELRRKIKSDAMN